MQDPFNAFSDVSVRIEGAANGPLAGLRFAAKDLFDVAGHVTGGGNPDWLASHPPAARTAPVIQALVDAGATLIGKTHTDELSRGIFGENAHYGTPVNPRAPNRVPGGSSSGSAVAVAASLVDFALGTDTGGSVRVPASFCGLYGIRPTHGRLKFDAVMAQAPSFDTIGWFSRDAELLIQVAQVLLGMKLERPILPRRLIVASDAFAVADPATAKALAPAVARLGDLIGNVAHRALSLAALDDWRRHQVALQGREAWETFSQWIDQRNPRFGFEVAEIFMRGASFNEAELDLAAKFRDQRRAELATLLDDGTVVCLPTTPFPAPLRGLTRSVMRGQRNSLLTLTCIAGLLGLPQLSMPLAELDGLPLGLSILAEAGADKMLLGLALAEATAR
ncbi:MAG: amidase [Xanthobacteraceae bacterium]|jgi:amidase